MNILKRFEIAQKYVGSSLGLGSVLARLGSKQEILGLSPDTEAQYANDLILLFRNTESLQYVYHPINSFNLIKRAKKWIPKLKLWLPDHILKQYDILNLPDEYLRACHGLADIQEHFDLNTLNISNGIIKDKKSEPSDNETAGKH